MYEQMWRPGVDAFVPSCLQDAALQCRKQLSVWLEDREELLKQLLDWAFGGFKPVGPDRVPPAVGGESPLVSDKPTSATCVHILKMKKTYNINDSVLV